MFNKDSIMQPEVDVDLDIIEESKTNPDTVEGVIVDCAKLNIRSVPNKNASVLCVVSSGTKLLIDVSSSTNDWYMVYTEAGIKGYCMKKYVNIGQ